MKRSKAVCGGVIASLLLGPASASGASGPTTTTFGPPFAMVERGECVRAAASTLCEHSATGSDEGGMKVATNWVPFNTVPGIGEYHLGEVGGAYTDVSTAGWVSANRATSLSVTFGLRTTEDVRVETNTAYTGGYVAAAVELYPPGCNARSCSVERREHLASNYLRDGMPSTPAGAERELTVITTAADGERIPRGWWQAKVRLASYAGGTQVPGANIRGSGAIEITRFTATVVKAGR